MECLRPTYLSKRDITVPCGHCPFCGATRRSDWALRLKYEAKMHLDSKFITLTYANPHLVWDDGKPQLHREHVQLFFKRVRKAGYELRYYGVGEYGSQTFRPHYHVLLFGDVPESVIREKWTYGEVHIGTVTQQSIAYCLSYMINSKGWKMSKGRRRVFNMMSKGIGRNYLTPDMIAWHKSGLKNFAWTVEGRRHLPRYYKLKIFNKLDLVRIAYRTQKEMYRNLARFVRRPEHQGIADLPQYYEDQRIELAKKIVFKAKAKLLI